MKMQNDDPKPAKTPKTLRVKRGVDVSYVLFELACAMGYPRADELVTRYLAGEWVQRDIGRHGVFHFNQMMEMLGHRPPRPRPE